MRLDRRSNDFDSYPERDGELELPDDLAAMAEQLADDAQRLAACYPPRFGPVADVAAAVASVRPRANTKRRWWLAGSVAGGVISLGIAMVLLLGGMNTEPQPIGDQLGATDGAVDDSADRTFDSLIANRTPVGLDHATEQASPPLVLPATTVETVPQITPAVFQRGVTGPEVEGWIDLAMDTESLEF